MGEVSTSQSIVTGSIHLEKAKLDISERLEGAYTQIRNAAQECDIAPDFGLGYKVLSKFAHPTAMLIMAQPNQEEERHQKDWFYSQGCLFFVGAFNALEERLSDDGQSIVMSHRHPPRRREGAQHSPLAGARIREQPPGEGCFAVLSDRHPTPTTAPPVRSS
jgi:hypothetical protein